MKKIVLAVMVVVMAFVGSAFADNVTFGIIAPLPEEIEVGPSSITKVFMQSDTVSTLAGKNPTSYLIRPLDFGTEGFWKKVRANDASINKYNSDVTMSALQGLTMGAVGFVDNLYVDGLTDGVYAVTSKTAVYLAIRKGDNTIIIDLTGESNSDLAKLIESGLSFMNKFMLSSSVTDAVTKYLDSRYMIDDEAIMTMADYNPEIMDALSNNDTKVVKFMNKDVKKSSSKQGYVGIKDGKLVINARLNNIPSEVIFTAEELAEAFSAVPFLTASER